MGLPRASRLRRPAEFQRVRNAGRRASDRYLAITAARLDGETQPRFGLAVGKGVGGAVVRNRVKRRLRELLGTLDMAIDWNVVVSARPAAADATFQDLSESLRRLAAKLGVIDNAA